MIGRRKSRLLALLGAFALLTGCGGDAPGNPPVQPESPPATESVDEVPPGAQLRCLYYERELFLGAMAAPRSYQSEGRLAAGMVPHHLLASDMIAGFFRLAAEDAQGYDTVLFVSPSHFPENCGSDVVTAGGSWQTPYGLVENDAAVTDRLLQNTAIGAEDNPAALEADHGVAGLVPFVAYYLPGAKVASCLLSNKLDRNRLAAVRGQIADICAGGRVLLVASVDCSHYLFPEEAALRDIETAEAIESMDLQRILSFSDANIDSPQALTTFVQSAQTAGAQLRQLDHSSSAEKLPHAISNPIYQEGITTYLVYAAFTEPLEAPS